MITTDKTNEECTADLVSRLVRYERDARDFADESDSPGYYLTLANALEESRNAIIRLAAAADEGRAQYLRLLKTDG
jgi:hypothetical protein